MKWGRDPLPISTRQMRCKVCTKVYDIFRNKQDVGCPFCAYEATQGHFGYAKKPPITDKKRPLEEWNL